MNRLYRDKKIEIRVNQLELLTLRDRAEQTGKTLSAYLRLQGLRRPIQQRQSEVSIKTYSDLGRIGNNINQLTHLAHLAKLEGQRNLPDCQVLEELNELLHQVRREIATGNLQDDDEEADEAVEED
jgi:DNA-binding SARP family transcriptional activator